MNTFINVLLQYFFFGFIVMTLLLFTYALIKETISEVRYYTKKYFGSK